MLNLPWTDATFVALDLETTGKYPLAAEICEFAAVKYGGGKIQDRFQTLIRPQRGMSAESIAIHNITPEMVKNSPTIEQIIDTIHGFINGCSVIAHHAPFDLGFLTYEFEKARLDLPTEPVFCTSLLSQKVVPETHDHRLRTLVAYFDIATQPNHRATDDADACLAVALKCFARVAPAALVQDLIVAQGIELKWSQYSIEALKERDAYRCLLSAIDSAVEVEMDYGGGSNPGRPRKIWPIGLVRNPDGDFVVAKDEPEGRPKRFYLEKISAARIVG
jgi:DNA polymerase-3 subunit epsilon